MNHLKVVLFLLLSLVILSGCSNGETEKNAYCSTYNQTEHPEIENYVIAFFKKYNSQEPMKAIDYIFSTNREPVPEEQIENLKTKLDSAYRIFGEFKGYSKIISKQASEDLYFCSYLVKHGTSPLRFNFVFYRPGKSWVLHNFSYDDKVIEELQESGKVYLLP